MYQRLRKPRGLREDAGIPGAIDVPGLYLAR
jgi:hypothetical protein